MSQLNEDKKTLLLQEMDELDEMTYKFVSCLEDHDGICEKEWAELDKKYLKLQGKIRTIKEEIEYTNFLK
ncbi:hypothetical protein AF332_11955 [Sporosarcina globispora]|uniref:Uncharacterized protein n=1 Tax=Sporosarcina globispora TaxID=1459 RepID=A0A0M0GC52_SPOGL|nr:hypothetical protein [Sporosarcina globispora]KON87470.1 hypothetical protein AF332_11955 [Sporosarcina globispora]